MTTETKHNLKEYENNIGLRKKYFLFTCTTGKFHLFDLEVPAHANKTLNEWYNLDVGFSFTDKLKGWRVPLMFRCAYCSKILTTNPKVCVDCSKAIQPLSKKLIERLITSRRKIICTCNEAQRNIDF